ncbi:DUF397 domain-containing protein [Streptomyces sp. NPDC014724]|uniref:DUF397 domain-containing protein n=1 Tax=unclassified Streptomyces TaxID=2593676 RepID=UPI0036F9F3A9
MASRIPDLGTAVWRKSSYSHGGDDNCPGLVPVRDSKTPTGSALVVTAPAWTAFVAFTAER